MLISQYSSMLRKSSRDFNRFTKLKADINFMPWECVSLIRRNEFTTLDFVVKEDRDLMILLNCLIGLIYGEEKHDSILHQFFRMKVKMKISYSGWIKRCILTK